MRRKTTFPGEPLPFPTGTGFVNNLDRGGHWRYLAHPDHSLDPGRGKTQKEDNIGDTGTARVLRKESRNMRQTQEIGGGEAIHSGVGLDLL